MGFHIVEAGQVRGDAAGQGGGGEGPPSTVVVVVVVVVVVAVADVSQTLLRPLQPPVQRQARHQVALKPM